MAAALAIDGVGAQALGSATGSLVISGFSTTQNNDVIIVDVQTVFATIISVTSAALGALSLRAREP